MPVTTDVDHRGNLLAQGAIVACLMAMYALTMPRAITFEDAGFFHQVCLNGGIAHPPGYPLFTLLCMPWYQLPFDPVLLGSALSALFAILTCLTVFAILRRCGRSVAAALIAVLALGLSLDFWSQAIIVEVYTLNTLLIAALIGQVLGLRDSPSGLRWWLAGITAGLALSNHWPLAVLSAPALLVPLVRRLSPRAVLLALGGLIMGLLPYAYLLLNDVPGYSYSGALTLAELPEYIRRDAFSGVDQAAGATLNDKFLFTGWLLQRGAWQFGLPLALMVVPGIVMIWRWQRDVAVMILLLVAMQLLGLGLLLGFEYSYLFRGVMRTYPLIAWLGLAFLLAFGIDWFLARAGDDKRLALVAVLLAWLPGLWVNHDANDRSRDTLARDYARLVLTSLPDRATLVLESDFQVGPLTFLQGVRGEGSDVTLYEAGNIYVTERLPGPSPAAAIADLSRERLFSIGVPQLEGEGSVRDFGYFLKVGEDGYERLAGSATLTRRVAAMYSEGHPRDPVSRYFAHQLLIALGVQLTAVALQNGADEALLLDLRAVQATFPGMLGSASATLTLAPGFPAAVLQERLAPFATQIPDVASESEIALFNACLDRVSQGGTVTPP